MRSWARGAVALGSLGLWLVACTEQLVVRPEGQFSWQPPSRMAWPVQGAVLSAFGDAARPSHQGIDLAARGGDPVAAAMLGRVEFVGDISGYGKVIVLSHADHLSTVYAHLGTEQVHEGDTVLQGQTIAAVGTDGYVHYEIREAKQPVDPAKYYPVAPQPLVASSVDVQKKVAREPASVGVLTGIEEEAALPPPTLRPTAARPPTPSAYPTATPYPTLTPTPTATPYPTLTPTPFPTATPYPTLTPTPFPTATPYATLTPTPLPTASPYPTAIPTPHPIPTIAARPHATGRAARTPAHREQSPGAARSSRHPSPVPTPEPPPPPPTAPPPTPVGESGAAEGQSPLAGVGLALEVLGANLFYVPAKLAYAGVGAVTGMFALALAHDTSVAQDVWGSALGGDYFVTADHVRGDAPLRFAGGG